MRKKNDTVVDLEVISLSKKGNGIGQYLTESGTTRTVEIPFTMPGDKVCTRLLRKQSGIYSSTLEEIVTYAKERVTPRCIHFGSCGGCRWQHVPYPIQLEWKESIVREHLAPHMQSSTQMRPIVACDPPWQYRNKMEFSFSSNRAKEHFLGLIMDSSNGKVLNLAECHLVNPWFIDALHAVKQWWADETLEAYHPYHNTGSLRTLMVREGQRTGDRLVMLTVSGNPEFALNRTQIAHFVDALRTAVEPIEGNGKLSIFLRIHQIIKGRPTQFYEMHLYGPSSITEILKIDLHTGTTPIEMRFTISPSAFFQPNTRQAERIYSIALEMAGVTETSVVYDLYCGTGTLGMCAAKKAKEVIGIELSPESAIDARTNAQEMGIENIRIVTGDVGKELAKLRQRDNLIKPDLIMVDPPRAGLDDQAIHHLIELDAPKILYISCNPATQATNLCQLLAKGRYQIAIVQPVDQFPHTRHIENLVLLTKP